MEGLGVGLLILLIVLYFVPALIAATRNAEHRNAIGAINLFLGWTVLGWLAALIWAVVEKPAAPRSARTSAMSEPFYK